MYNCLNVHVERVNVTWTDRKTRGGMIADVKRHVDNLEMALKEQLDSSVALRSVFNDIQGNIAEV